MGKNDRSLSLLSTSYRRNFSIGVNFYLEQWNAAYKAGPRTVVEHLDGREVTFTVGPEDYSAEECLARAHRQAWIRAVRDVASRYGRVWGLDGMELPVYHEALASVAPKEWLPEFLGKPVPGTR